MSFRTATAHSTAATIEGNSSSTPSPVVLTILPPCLANDGIDGGAVLPQRPCRTGPVGAHQAAVARDIDGQDRREPAFDPMLFGSGHPDCPLRRYSTPGGVQGSGAAGATYGLNVVVQRGPQRKLPFLWGPSYRSCAP